MPRRPFRATAPTLLALAAVAVAFVAGAVQLLFVVPLSSTGFAWISPALSVALAPAVTFAALCVVLVWKGSVRPLPAVLSGAAAALGFVAAAGAAVLFSISWDDADAGGATSGAGRAAILLIGTGWALGAVALAPLLHAVLPGRWPNGQRWLLAILLAGPSAFVIGSTLLTPATAMVASVAVLLGALRLHPSKPTETPVRAAARPAGSPAATPVRLGSVAESRRLAARGLAWATAGLGVAAAVVALTGSAWLPGINGTETMRLGVILGLIVAVPLAISADLVASARVPERRAGIHLASALLIGGLLAAAVGHRLAAGSAMLQWNLIVLSAVLEAAAAGVAVYALGSATRAQRLVLGLVGAAAYGIVLGIGVASSASFLAPVLAVLWALFGTRRPKTAPQPAEPAPV